MNRSGTWNHLLHQVTGGLARSSEPDDRELDWMIENLEKVTKEMVEARDAKRDNPIGPA